MTAVHFEVPKVMARRTHPRPAEPVAELAVEAVEAAEMVGPTPTEVAAVEPLPVVVRRSRVDLTAVAVVGEIAAGAVAVAWQLARRQPAPHANVQMGPGGWVSLRGGRVRLAGRGRRRAGHRGHTCSHHRMTGRTRRLSWLPPTGRS
ncbi:hypothetical protein MXD62_02095 [Frankia sp. Mgl5]|uniref:hypothetical protein n=1 Tax=Frankia sp. Mgl5 TaxID=2933793 RepID=UPI00200D6532|nr:hypothetical protein [Frankia sp. Mgl5]MCK9925963.1 hypothetical protein [Frankia sp. Mgl5]